MGQQHIETHNFKSIKQWQKIEIFSSFISCEMPDSIEGTWVIYNKVGNE